MKNNLSKKYALAISFLVVFLSCILVNRLYVINMKRFTLNAPDDAIELMKSPDFDQNKYIMEKYDYRHAPQNTLPYPEFYKFYYLPKQYCAVRLYSNEEPLTGFFPQRSFILPKLIEEKASSSSLLDKIICTDLFGDYNTPPPFGFIGFYSTIILSLIISLILKIKLSDKKIFYYTSAILLAILIIIPLLFYVLLGFLYSGGGPL